MKSFVLKNLLLSGSLFCIAFSSCNGNLDSSASNITTIDSLLQKARETNVPAAMHQAYEEVKTLQNDSVKMNYYTHIAYLLANSTDSTFFKQVNEEALLLARKLGDTLHMGEGYWHYGIHYMQWQDYGQSYLHYEKALQHFRHSKPYYAAKMLYNMALIKTHIKDYTGSEVLVYKAISQLLPLKKYKQLYLCHILLGAIHENLDEYNMALDHYRQAMVYLERHGDGGIYLLDLQNNLGVLFQKMGNQDRAIALFNTALKADEHLREDPALHARIIDNRAYSYFLKEANYDVVADYCRALNLRDSIKNRAGIVMSHIHLAEYYLREGDSAQAVHHASWALQLGQELELNRDALTALQLLARADSKKREDYLSQHIALNKILTRAERVVRDKFTRIEYETASYIEDNKRLARDKAVIAAGAGAVVIILLLLFTNFRARAKNKALAFESEQQKANEKIYLLTLKQQENLVRGRLEERRRISEDLHDSILARLFGIRINWAFLNIDGESGAIIKHREYLGELQKIEKEIRDISHDLRNELYISENQYIQNLRALVKKWEKQGKFSAELKIVEEATWERTNSYLKTNIYKIMEEALHNIVQHARANKVKLVLKANKQVLSLYIEDDGIGYTKRFAETGIGIKNIKSRTKKMGGTCVIEGIPGQGTKICVRIPLKY
jgi:signal transduction histidine kinase/tetratricopeptide (TPR) repeat protein